MNKKTVFKLFLDILMTIIFILLINLKVTGLLFHEIVGIGVFLFVILHNILNISFIKYSAKQIINRPKSINKKSI